MNEMTPPAHDAAVTTTRGEAAADARRLAKRKRLFLALLGGVAVIGAGYYAYDTMIASRHATTDNAYVGADTADITPLVSGPVEQVLVANAEMVHPGQVLVRLDSTDARIALARADANLANAKRSVRALIATDANLSAQVAARGAEALQADANLAAAKARLAKAKIDLARRRAVLGSGGVSADEVTSAQDAFSTAAANLQAAEAALALTAANRDAAIAAYQANHAHLAGTTVDTNPAVLVALAARDQAQVDLDRTVIRAPVDGVVTSRDVQVGQQVQAGAQLMLVVPVGHAYVDANFKEGQLAKVRPGQPVTLTSDLYGGKVIYHGRVVGFAGGTGAAFAVLPAQNATGNWIKVVQRLPVRIALDPQELAAHPLRVGLSMEADIDIAKGG
jgi:membrane fusion protein (multidrug efflux system)